MRQKRNKKNITITTNGYIKRFFGTDIGRILSPNNRSFQNCEIPYVSHPEAEKTLEDCLEGDPLKDKSLVFTGLTGSGKTTILRHVFGLEANANKPRIDGNIIIIPVDFNRPQKSAQDAILSSLRAAVKSIVRKYRIGYPDINNEGFYEFVEERRPDFLELEPKHNRLTQEKDRMEVFLETMPTTFASCQLQYVMNQAVCNLDLVVLIVDNIEAFMNPNAKNLKTKYLSPIIEAFELAECISQRGDYTKWCFNMVIACRHHIWRIMKGEFTDNSQENAVLQSYVTTEQPYDLSSPIGINDIIKKREEVFSRRQQNPRRWDDAVKVVNTVLQTMENCIGDFVVQLELKDLRKSMSKMQELILHRGLQKKSDEQIIDSGAFQIDSVDQFDLTRVNLIRTIGLSNRKYYSDSNSIIPNLLFNNRQEGMELWILLILNHFLIRSGYTEPAWDNPISLSEFYETMKSIFGHQGTEKDNLFEQSVCFLIQKRLLLRSADQPQDEVPGLSLTDIRKIEYVYVSGATVKLWEELGKSSALFQLFLDDIWLEEDADYFSKEGNDIEHCIKYVQVLMQAERKIYNSAKNISVNSEEEYVKTFGVEPVCKQLLKGLYTSLEAISTSGDPRSQSRIIRAKETLKKENILWNELMEWEAVRKKIRSSV